MTHQLCANQNWIYFGSHVNFLIQAKKKNFKLKQPCNADSYVNKHNKNAQKSNYRAINSNTHIGGCRNKINMKSIRMAGNT